MTYDLMPLAEHCVNGEEHDIVENMMFGSEVPLSVFCQKCGAPCFVVVEKEA